jgi:6-phosphofructokinase 1
MIIETMGRHCGDLAIFGALAGGVEVLSTPEVKLTEDQIIKEISDARNKGLKREIITLVTEGMYDINALSKKVEKQTGIVTRPLILSNLQRGGVPSSRDRILASRMGVFAVEELIAGKQGIAICSVNGEMVSKDIMKAIAEKQPDRKGLIKVVKMTS